MGLGFVGVGVWGGDWMGLGFVGVGVCWGSQAMRTTGSQLLVAPSRPLVEKQRCLRADGGLTKLLYQHNA